LCLVSRIDCREGESKNLTWVAPFISIASGYNIYHFYDDKNKTIIRVPGDSANSIDPVKYVYHTRPYNSTDIKFEIRNIALMDAGYYAGGASFSTARSTEGVILVVKGEHIIVM
jgi:hypothetical protein